MKKERTIIENFSDFACGLTIEDIPERVIEKIKLQIFTILSAVKFSDWHPEALKIYNAEKRKPQGRKGATVIALNQKLGPESAAVVNAAFAMSLDFDDYMLMGHTGYSSVLTPLAFLERGKGTLEDLIVAAAVSNEVMGRLSLACFFGPLNGQMWSYIHNLGAAAAIAKVKKFNIEKTANAMAISLCQPNFCLVPGFWNKGSKLLTASIPLRSGIQAALFADDGLEGPWDIIEAPLGFLHFFSFFPMKEFMSDLGTSWLSETLRYKRYPGTSYVGGSVDSALSAMERLGINSISDIEKVEKIDIDAFFLSYGIESISAAQNFEKLDAIAINFSVRYSVAYALLRGNLLPEFFKEDEIDIYENDIQRLAAKINVRHDWPMTIRTLKTFPGLARILKRMKSNERRRLIEHSRAVSRKSALGVSDIIAGFRAILSSTSVKDMIKVIFAKDEGPISLANVDLVDYPMFQSARTKISLKNGKNASVECSILTGGSGEDFRARKEWVAKRYELAFHKDSDRIFKLMENLDIPVRFLIKECLDKN